MSFSFPPDPEYTKKWKNVARPGPFKLKQEMYLCSDHFGDNDIIYGPHRLRRLQPYAIPKPWPEAMPTDNSLCSVCKSRKWAIDLKLQAHSVFKVLKIISQHYDMKVR